MLRLSINEVTTYRWSFEEDVAGYAEAGIKAIGVWRQKLSDFGEEKGIELLKDTGLEVSNLLWCGGFTGSDGHTFQESLADAAEAVRLAGEMGAACLVVYTGARAGHTQNHARRLVRQGLTELAPLAEKHQVTMAIEPMHVGCASEFTFLSELDDALDLIHTVGSPWAKLAFDTYHLGHDPKIVDRIADLVPDVGILHLADARGTPEREQNRVRLGDGILPLREILAAFTAAGYDGYCDVELIGEEIEACDYRELIEHSKQTFDRWTADAAS